MVCMPKPPEKQKPRSRRFLIIVTLFALLPVAFALFAFAQESLSFRLDPRYETFVRLCGTCHGIDRPRSFAKSPVAWKKTVDIMLSKGTIAVSENDVEQVVALLIRHRSADGQTLFRQRCGRCHSTKMLEPYYDLHPSALRLLVRQHVIQNNFAVQTWEGELIEETIAAIQRERGTPDQMEAGDRSHEAYQHACGACHTISFIYREMCGESKAAREWLEITERMRGKTPDFISEKDVSLLAERAEAICRTGNVAY